MQVYWIYRILVGWKWKYSKYVCDEWECDDDDDDEVPKPDELKVSC